MNQIFYDLGQKGLENVYEFTKNTPFSKGDGTKQEKEEPEQNIETKSEDSLKSAICHLNEQFKLLSLFSDSEVVTEAMLKEQEEKEKMDLEENARAKEKEQENEEQANEEKIEDKDSTNLIETGEVHTPTMEEQFSESKCFKEKNTTKEGSRQRKKGKEKGKETKEIS